jgi:hypothetical protein
VTINLLNLTVLKTLARRLGETENAGEDVIKVVPHSSIGGCAITPRTQFPQPSFGMRQLRALSLQCALGKRSMQDVCKRLEPLLQTLMTNDGRNLWRKSQRKPGYAPDLDHKLGRACVACRGRVIEALKTFSIRQ